MKTTPIDSIFGWLVITSRRVITSGHQNSPHIRKSSLDHDSGGKIGGVRHMYSPPFTRLTGVRLERGTGTSSTQIVFSYEYC